MLIDVAKLDEGNTANQYKGYEGSMNNHARVYDEFIHVIGGGKKKYVSGEEGMQSVGMIEQFYKAAAKSV